MKCPICTNSVPMLFPTARGDACISCRVGVPPATVTRPRGGKREGKPHNAEGRKRGRPMKMSPKRQPASEPAAAPPPAPKPPPEPKPIKARVQKPRARPLKEPKGPERMTLDEQFAASLGFVNVPFSNHPSSPVYYPRGVWQCPKTGHLHTAAVVRLMQRELGDGKPCDETRVIDKLEAEQDRADELAALAAAQEAASKPKEDE